MKKPRTVAGWLKTLPKYLRSEIIILPEYQKDKKSELSHAIFWGVNWTNSLEGWDFWEGFYHMLQWAEEQDNIK